MIEFGRTNRLTVVDISDTSIRLDGGQQGRLFVAKSELDQPVALGDSLDVFVYTDPDKGPTATTQRPLSQAGECALLRVVAVTQAGAFLDWGLKKDLFVPAREQQEAMQQGRSYMVCLYNDRGQRTVASSRIDHFLDQNPPDYRTGDRVQLIIDDRTDIGTKAIVDHSYWGVIHQSDLYQTLHYGQKIEGYIKKVRDDGKLDLSLQPIGHRAAVDLADQIMAALARAGGFLPLNDRSRPEEIQQYFATSKKKFKMALGTLYKQRQITLEADGIRQVEP